MGREITGPTEGGSYQSVRDDAGGSKHVSAWNEEADIRCSEDVAADGTKSGGHWTEQSTKRRIGDDD